VSDPRKRGTDESGPGPIRWGPPETNQIVSAAKTGLLAGFGENEQRHERDVDEERSLDEMSAPPSTPAPWPPAP
jgi:hypothetical protein